MTEETKDRKIGTEIFSTRAPNLYFSVPIFLSDPSSSSSPLFESSRPFVVSSHWFRQQSALKLNRGLAIVGARHAGDSADIFKPQIASIGALLILFLGLLARVGDLEHMVLDVV